MSSTFAAAPDSVLGDTKEYYGKTLTKTEDLKTSACTMGPVKIPKAVRLAMKEVHDEVNNRYYGCGLVIPDALENTSVLDLGSGAGRDCFIISRLVGENGHVTGLDMTEEQLKVANDYITYHTEKFGYSKPNVDFVHGYIEKLKEAGLKDNTFDIIVSNCVVNLSPDKKAVISEAHRVLKDGGELYFSDIYADCDLPNEVRQHKVLWGECVAGALFWEDLYKLAEEIGFSKPRLVAATPLTIDREDLKQVVGDAKFVSATYRLYKLPSTQQSASSVTYNGAIVGAEKEFNFDHRTSFKNGEAKKVNGELATILSSSRFSRYFDIQPAQNSCCIKDLGAPVDPLILAANTKVPAGGSCCS